MTKLLAAVIGVAFVFAASNFTYAQAPATTDRSGLSTQDPTQDMARSQGMSKKKVKKAKKAKKTKKRTAKRSRGMARPN